MYFRSPRLRDMSDAVMNFRLGSHDPSVRILYATGAAVGAIGGSAYLLNDPEMAELYSWAAGTVLALGVGYQFRRGQITKRLLNQPGSGGPTGEDLSGEAKPLE